MSAKVRGYALTSSVPGVPITAEIALDLCENLRRVEALWHQQLTDPANPNAQEWGCVEQAEVHYNSEIGVVNQDPGLAVVQLVAALPEGTNPTFAAYHTKDDRGRPLALISYVVTGSEWTVAMSHEMCEARVNSTVSQQSPPAPDGTTWDLEVCDPVQETDYTEPGTTTKVANAVGPAFFELGNGPLDIAGAAQYPFHELPGGYHDGSVGQIYGALVSLDKRMELANHGIRGKWQRAKR